MRPPIMLASVTGAVAAAIFACHAPPNVIAPELAEKAITVGLTDKGIDLASVKCPPDQPSRAGATFTCTATPKAGDAIPVDVSVQDESGHVTWDVRGVIVHEKLMGEGIAAKANGAITVSCPDKVVVIAVGSSFLCDAGSGSTKQHISIRIEDKQGDETWRLVP